MSDVCLVLIFPIINCLILNKTRLLNNPMNTIKVIRDTNYIYIYNKNFQY